MPKVKDKGSGQQVRLMIKIMKVHDWVKVCLHTSSCRDHKKPPVLLRVGKKKGKTNMITRNKNKPSEKRGEPLLRVLQNKYEQLCFKAELPELTLSTVSQTPVTKGPSKSLGEHQYL